MSANVAAADNVNVSRWKSAAAGASAGAFAGIVLTVVMLLLAQMFGLATPLVLLGDRLSVFIPADTFLELMGRVGGYNRMKQLGVGSVMVGQILVGAGGGMLYGLVMRRGRGAADLLDRCLRNFTTARGDGGALASAWERTTAGCRFHAPASLRLSACSFRSRLSSGRSCSALPA